MAKTARITAILVVVLVLSLVVFTACDSSLKDEINKFKKADNYVAVRTLIGNDLNAYFQNAEKEFEASKVEYD
jgi:hypothetical protein